MRIGGINIRVVRLIGRKVFHVKYISLSYRMRGKVHRIHTNVIARIIVIIINHESLISWIGGCPVKNTMDNSLIIRMFVYSAMKIRANRPPLYSVLNPDTSSDSPSARSKGVRLVSARLVVNQIMKSGEIINSSQDFMLMDIEFISIVWCRIRALSRIRDIDTS